MTRREFKQLFEGLYDELHELLTKEGDRDTLHTLYCLALDFAMYRGLPKDAKRLKQWLLGHVKRGMPNRYWERGHFTHYEEERHGRGHYE